jgi:hypothetical protein
VKENFQFLQDIASKGAVLILLRLRDMFLSATNLVGLSVCSFLVTIGFSTSQQQFVGRQLLLAHSGSGNGRTLVDRRMATMTVMTGPLFEERGILEESSQPEGAGGGFCISLGRRVGRTRGQKLVERREKAKEGPIAVANFRLSFPALRVVEKFRMKGEYEGERGGRER